MGQTGIPLPVATGVAPVPVGFVHSTATKFSGGFVQADYLAMPWVMLIMRYDGVNSWADFANGQESITAGALAMAKAPRPMVSRIVESPMSGLASRAP